MNPEAGLLLASDGWLYGTTYATSATNRGNVFRIAQDGSGFTVLHTFLGAPDLQNPECQLTEGSDGLLYGTADFGGSNSGGGVFALAKDGSSYNILHNFRSITADGSSPTSGVIEGSDHVLYGATYYGGGSGMLGIVYSLNKDGSNYQILHRFSSSNGDGESPNIQLVQLPDGTLVGGTYNGTSNNVQGMIYGLKTDGSGYQTLHGFGNGGGGSTPRGDLLLAPTGTIYGTTSFGAVGGAGCIFALSSAPLAPRIMALNKTGNTNVFYCCGTSLSSVDLLGTTDWVNWTVLATQTTQTNGQNFFTYQDSGEKAHYFRLQLH